MKKKIWKIIFKSENETLDVGKIEILKLVKTREGRKNKNKIYLQTNIVCMDRYEWVVYLDKMKYCMSTYLMFFDFFCFFFVGFFFFWYFVVCCKKCCSMSSNSLHGLRGMYFCCFFVFVLWFIGSKSVHFSFVVVIVVVVYFGR